MPTVKKLSLHTMKIVVSQSKFSKISMYGLFRSLQMIDDKSLVHWFHKIRVIQNTGSHEQYTSSQCIYLKILLSFDYQLMYLGSIQFNVEIINRSGNNVIIEIIILLCLFVKLSDCT